MPSSQTHRTEHQITVEAPARAVYDVVADVTQWPTVFPPSVHVEYVRREAATEVIRIWATANDTVRRWTSRRELDPERLWIRFRQQVSQPPVASMGGEWIIEPLGSEQTLVRLTHDFQAVGDDPENTSWILRAIDHNSDAELASLKAAAERRAERDELTLTFDDVVEVNGAVEDVYDFIDQAGHWKERLPHVDRVQLTEETPGVQILEMDTLTTDGSAHTTRSVRICTPHERIIYKQLRTPALTSVHTGQWRFERSGDGTVVASTHTVVLAPEAIRAVMGPDATPADAKEYLRAALGRNSTATMLAAKEYAEGRRAAAKV